MVDMLKSDREAVFDIVKQRIDGACQQLNFLANKYALADNMDPMTKLARIAAIRAKQDYLRGLSFNPNAHPWVEDD